MGRNFAGVVGSSSFMTDTTAEDFLKCMAVNTLGVFLCTKHQIKQMMKQDPIQVYVMSAFDTVFWEPPLPLVDPKLIAKFHRETGRPIQRGSIVNCASVNSIQAAQTVGPYTASKHAVMGITKVVRTVLTDLNML